jgi:hypothetical protein
MLARNALSLFTQWLADTLKDNAEILIVFHEFQDVDNHIACPRIGHHALHLPHLMQP